MDSKRGIERGEGFVQAADPRFQTVDPTGAVMAVARCLFLSEDDARSFRQRPGHMVAFEFAVECRALDAEDLGGFRFVPAGVFHRGEDMLLLDIGIEPRPSLGRDYAMGCACSSTRWRLLSVVLEAKECGDVSALFVPTHKALWVG